MHFELRLVSSPGGEKLASLQVSLDDQRPVHTIWEESIVSNIPIPSSSVDGDGFKIPPRPSLQTEQTDKRPAKRRRTSKKNDVFPTPPNSSLLSRPADGNVAPVDHINALPFTSPFANPKWTHEEDQIVRKGLRMGWNSTVIRDQLGPYTIRSGSAIRARKAILKQNMTQGVDMAPSSSPSTAVLPGQDHAQRNALVRPQHGEEDTGPSSSPPTGLMADLPETVVPSRERPTTLPAQTSSLPIPASASVRGRSPVVLVPRQGSGKLKMPSRVPSSVAEPAPSTKLPVASTSTPEGTQRTTRKRRRVSSPSSELPTSGQRERIPSATQEAPTSGQRERVTTPTPDLSTGGQRNPNASQTTNVPGVMGPAASTTPQTARAKGKQKAVDQEWSRHDLLKSLPADFVANLIRVRAHTEDISKKRAREDTLADNAMWEAMLNDDERLADEVERFRRVKRYQRAVADGEKPPGRRNRLTGLEMLKTSDNVSVDESFGPEDDFGQRSYDSDEARPDWKGLAVESDDPADWYESDSSDDDDAQPGIIRDREFIDIEEPSKESLAKKSTRTRRANASKTKPAEPAQSPRGSKNTKHTKSKKARGANASRSDGMSRRKSASPSSSVAERANVNANGEPSTTAQKNKSKDKRTNAGSGSLAFQAFEGRWADILRNTQHAPPAPAPKSSPKTYSFGELHNLYFGSSSEEKDGEDDEDESGSE